MLLTYLFIDLFTHRADPCSYRRFLPAALDEQLIDSCGNCGSCHLFSFLRRPSGTIRISSYQSIGPLSTMDATTAIAAETTSSSTMTRRQSLFTHRMPVTMIPTAALMTLVMMVSCMVISVSSLYVAFSNVTIVPEYSGVYQTVPDPLVSSTFLLKSLRLLCLTLFVWWCLHLCNSRMGYPFWVILIDVLVVYGRIHVGSLHVIH
jgi:hypothetical protein